MNPITKVILTALTVAGSALNSLAQTATASISASVVTPISIVKNADMSFGNVAVSASVGGSAILSPAGARTTGGAGGLTLPATAGTVSPASFTINGQANYSYAITLPGSCTINDGSGNTITGNAFTSAPSVSGVLNAFGTQVLSIGATLNLSANQHPGSYTNAAGLPVTVNYN